MMKIQQVVAGVIFNDANEVLLTSRPEGKIFAHWWEFPGGKVESGENLRTALIRELHEEINLSVCRAHQWLKQTVCRDHVLIQIYFLRIFSRDWGGILEMREGQNFTWHNINDVPQVKVLVNNASIMRALALPLRIDKNKLSHLPSGYCIVYDEYSYQKAQSTAQAIIWQGDVPTLQKLSSDGFTVPVYADRFLCDVLVDCGIHGWIVEKDK